MNEHIYSLKRFLRIICLKLVRYGPFSGFMRCKIAKMGG